jgi:hypothetical protein
MKKMQVHIGIHIYGHESVNGPCCMFFDAQDLIHYEFMPKGCTVKKEIMSQSSDTSSMQWEGNIGKKLHKTAGSSAQRTCT